MVRARQRARLGGFRMKLTHILATTLAAIALTACQPPAPAEPETPAVEAPATPEETATATPAALPCGVIDQRNWSATRSAGSSPALTVAGEIDLPTPGYSVSLARDPAESASTTEPRLILTLRPPSGVVAQVVTPTPVRYFGPAPAAYTAVHVVCDGQPLTDLMVRAE